MIINEEYEISYKSSFNNQEIPPSENWRVLKIYPTLKKVEEFLEGIQNKLKKGYKLISKKDGPTIIATFEAPITNPGENSLTEYVHLRIRSRLKLNLDDLEKIVK